MTNPKVCGSGAVAVVWIKTCPSAQGENLDKAVPFSRTCCCRDVFLVMMVKSTGPSNGKLLHDDDDRRVVVAAETDDVARAA